MPGLTNYPNGITSFGAPVMGGGGMGLPVMSKNGKVFFVDPANGNDGNNGSFAHPFDTVSAAYAKTVDKRGDVIVLLNDGNTSGTAREDATLTWGKDNTHLIGWCAPTMVSQRARISPTTTLGSIVTPQLNVTGNGNIFANLSFFEGDDENTQASVGVAVTGHRNFFGNVAIMNMGDAATGNSGDEAGSAHLTITAGEENRFERCYIGLDTAPRTAANANVRFASAAARNQFVDCFFPMFADADAPLFIDANSSGALDRWTLFERCQFVNATSSTATSGTAAMAVHASVGGMIIVKDCLLTGMADWTAADNTNVKLMNAVWDATTVKNSGIAGTVDVT